MKTVLIFACAIALGSTSAIAQDVPSARVRFADLDLGSGAGQAALYQRIQAAATHVCDVYSGTKGLENFTAGRACYKAAVADGMTQMNKLVAARDSGTFLAASSIIISAR
jgi:UrcA family protein